MTRWLIAAALLLAACTSTTPPPTTTLAPKPLTQTEVLELEGRWTHPIVANDRAALRALLTSDFAGTGVDGIPFETADELAQAMGAPFPAGARMNTFEDGLVLRPGVTVVAGEVYVRVGEAPPINRTRYTATWLLRGGQWQLAALHLSPAPKPPGS